LDDAVLQLQDGDVALKLYREARKSAALEHAVHNRTIAKAVAQQVENGNPILPFVQNPVKLYAYLMEREGENHAALRVARRGSFDEMYQHATKGLPPGQFSNEKWAEVWQTIPDESKGMLYSAEQKTLGDALCVPGTLVEETVARYEAQSAKLHGTTLNFEAEYQARAAKLVEQEKKIAAMDDRVRNLRDSLKTTNESGRARIAGLRDQASDELARLRLSKAAEESSLRTLAEKEAKRARMWKRVQHGTALAAGATLLGLPAYYRLRNYLGSP